RARGRKAAAHLLHRGDGVLGGGGQGDGGLPPHARRVAEGNRVPQAAIAKPAGSGGARGLPSPQGAGRGRRPRLAKRAAGRGEGAISYGSNGIGTEIQVRTGTPSLMAGWNVHSLTARMAASVRPPRPERRTWISTGVPVSETRTCRITMPPIRACSASGG